MRITIYRPYHDDDHNENSKRTLSLLILHSMLVDVQLLNNEIICFLSTSSLCATHVRIALFVQALDGKLLLFFYCGISKEICGQRSSIMCHIAWHYKPFFILWKCENARKRKAVASSAIYGHLRIAFLSRFTAFFWIWSSRKTPECVYIQLRNAVELNFCGLQKLT